MRAGSRRPRELLRIAGLLLAVAGLGWLAGQIVADAAADRLAAAAPERALAWDPGHAEALVAVGQAGLAGGTDPDLDAVEILARNALRADPLQEPALRVLGLAAARRGDKARAAALMHLALQRSQRDVEAHAWLANEQLAAGDVTGGLQHIDAILRTQPVLGDSLFPVVVGVAADPAAAKPLADIFGARPPWRGQFITVFAATAASAASVTRLFAALDAGPAPPTDGEVGVEIRRLVHDQRYEEAHLAWTRTLPADQRQTPSLLYDGDFRNPSRSLLFDWLLTPTAGTEIAIRPPAADGPGRLSVTFSGARVVFNNVAQLLLLSPGRYALAGKVEATALNSRRGLWWRVYCVEHEDATLGQSELVSGTFDWRPFGFVFEVPATGCRAQWLRLELPARVALESAISGQVSYTALAITRSDLPAASAMPPPSPPEGSPPDAVRGAAEEPQR